MRTERQIAGTGNVERVIAHLPRRLVEALVNRLLNAFLSVYDHGHLIGLRQLVVLRCPRFGRVAFTLKTLVHFALCLGKVVRNLFSVLLRRHAE